MDDTHSGMIRRLRDSHALAKLVGEAPEFLKAIAHLSAAARSDASVLVTGETGTGKELVARAVHYLSERAAFPFVAVNCGALTDTLMEDELFGHEAGAFTDARHHRQGLLAQADTGTLFLDEIEALTERGQVMLLRVLQDQVFRPLGASHEHKAHVRFIAATNAALAPRVQRGTFRADLYYRLCVFQICLPALRERSGDILLLADHFVRKHARPPRPPRPFSAAARAALLAYDWPGNVRELENAMIRALWVCGTETIEPEDLALPGHAASAAPATAPSEAAPRTFRALKKDVIEAFECDYLKRLMREHCGNVTRAARTAGKDRRELGKLLRKYHVDPKFLGGAATEDDPPGGNPPTVG